MLKWILGVIVGYIVGSAVMMGVHIATQPMYPPPEGVDVWDPDQRDKVEEWMETLPNGAFALALLAHMLGTAAGAATTMAIVGRERIKPAIVIGVLFTVAGIINIFSVPHPGWFPFADIPCYLIAAWLVGKLMLKKPAGAAETIA
ncbi:MAG: hypothetical protein P1V36_04505 [Planctomycetota bacterium]|nr:hypothetical protein [Planctomycetota bacterium]